MLHFSESAAYSRITDARVARQCPIVLTLLTDGAITLTTLNLLAGHLTMLVSNLERSKHASTPRPRPRATTASASRHVPAAVRRIGWSRDEGRCAFVGTNGRCSERGFLEFHHVVPFAAGGAADAENLQLRCRSHNAYEARSYFGDAHKRSARPAMERRKGTLKWGRPHSSSKRVTVW